MQINDGTIFWTIILAGVFFTAKIDNAIKFLIISSAMTTVAVFNINNNSILVLHIAFTICLIKFCVYMCKNDTCVSVDKYIYYFAIWCLITIPFSLLHGNTIVHNVNGLDTYVKFSFQQITQYGYLIIGLLTCIMCNSLLITNKISIKSVDRCLEISYVISLSIALLQHILPVALVNAYLRNAAHVSYNYDGARISGTFFEPSMLSLFFAPLFGKYLYKLTLGFNVKYLLYITLFVVVAFDSNSSSAVLGIIVSLVLVFLISLSSNKKVSLNDMIFAFLIIIAGTISVMHFYSDINLGIDMLFNKISGEGISGNSRLERFKYHFELGINNFIPTGFGTVRSFDLLSTWICSIGIIGLALYLIPVIILCIKLYKINTYNSKSLFICILVHNIIMFISVPEFSFLSIWIYYGTAYYIIENTNRREKTNPQQNNAIRT